jgi:large conductance mechanosensitive channel
MIKGFRNFLMQGSVVTIAIGLMVALAFSTLIKAFTDAIINPILNRFQGGSGIGLGIQLGDKGNAKTFLDIGSAVGGDLLHRFHGRALLSYRRALQGDHGATRRDRLR